MAGKMKLNLKKGALHRMLGVKQGKKLAPGMLYKAAHSENPLERKRARLAITMRGWKKKGKKVRG